MSISSVPFFAGISIWLIKEEKGRGIRELEFFIGRGGWGRWGRGQRVTKFVLLVQFYSKSMLPCFFMSDTYDFITSIWWVYFNHFRGVMKIRIAVTLVVLGLLHTYIHTYTGYRNEQIEGSYNSRTIIDRAISDPKFCRQLFWKCIRLCEKSFQWCHHHFMTSSSWPSLKNSGF